MIVTFFVPGTPVTWKRARSNGARRWTDPRDRQWRDALRLGAMAARPKGWPLSARYVVAIDVLVKRDVGDVDNFAKALLDAAKGVLWDDDVAVVDLHVRRMRVDDMTGMSVAVVADETMRRSAKRVRKAAA